MEYKGLMLTVLAAAFLGGCVENPPRPEPVVVYESNPYVVGDGIDMTAPVYLSGYPGQVFYHRYDAYCDCIVLVRRVDSGGPVYWVDQFGKRRHEGHWEPSRPTPHAMDGYRHWAHEQHGKFHREPPPGQNFAPPSKQVPPQPVRAPNDPWRPGQGPLPGVTANQPPPPVKPGSADPTIRTHRDGENGAGVWRKPPDVVPAPTPKPIVQPKDQPKVKDQPKDKIKDQPRVKEQPKAKEQPKGKDQAPGKPDGKESLK